jgi:hypothetical protein
MKRDAEVEPGLGRVIVSQAGVELATSSGILAETMTVVPRVTDGIF